MAGRPKKDLKHARHSITLSPEAEEIIERGGFHTNLSAFLDGLVRNVSEESTAFMAIKIERLGGEIARKEAELLALRTELNLYQAQLNTAKERKAGDGRLVHEARMELLRKWDQANGRSGLFIDCVTGPANLHLVKDAGFASATEAETWCRTESRRR